MAVSRQHDYAALRELGELGRQVERERRPDPYPRPEGPAPSLQGLREHRDEIEAVTARHCAGAVKVFGSVARGEASQQSDLDLLVEFNGNVSLLRQAALQRELEELLQCPVHLVSVDALGYARAGTRQHIEREAVAL